MRSPLATLIRSLVLAAAIWIVGTLVACAPASGVWSDGDAIHYRGELSEELNDRVYALYDAPAVNPTRLVIQSGGGNVELGLDLGEFIIDEQLDVSVPKYCISSCANYVFTAGRRKLLGKHALVGFHGGATSPGLLDRSLAELRADPPPGLSDAEIAELERGLIDYFTEWQAREAAFFDRIGVDASITVFAQADSLHSYPCCPAYWIYSVAGLEHFGVRDVEVASPPHEPRRVGRDDFFLIPDEYLSH